MSQFWSPFPGDTELERSAKGSPTSASIGHEGRGEKWDLDVSENVGYIPNEIAI